jgi:hypothetical protein
MAKTEENVKVAVLFEDTGKTDKVILQKVFEAYSVPADFYMSPAFRWEDIVKTAKLVVACGDELFQDVCIYTQAHKISPGIWKLPLPSQLIQKEENLVARAAAAQTIQEIKLEIEQLLTSKRVLSREELTNLTVETILSIRTSKIEPITLRVGGRTLVVGKSKKQKLDKNTFTFEELLAVKLLQDLMNLDKVEIVDGEKDDNV